MTRPIITKNTRIKDGVLLPDPEHIIRTGLGDTLCYFDAEGIFFLSSPVTLYKAEYEVNRQFVGIWQVPIGEYFAWLEFPEPYKTRVDKGWSQYQGEISYGYTWIDFTHIPGLTQSGKPVIIIITPFPPHEDYRDDPDPYY